MSTIRIAIALGLWAITIFTFASSITGQEEGRKCSVNRAKKLLGDLTYGDAKKSEKARVTLVETRAKDLKNILKAFDRGFHRDPKKIEGKGTAVEVKVAKDEAGCPDGLYRIRIPKSYRGKKPVPLLFRFHGSGDTAQSYAEFTASGSKLLDQMIVVVPQIPSADRMAWSQDGAKHLVDRILREVMGTYNVDRDRIYFSGFSAGGGAAVYLTQDWPHRVAAFWSSARSYVKYGPAFEESCDCAAEIPGLFMVGLDDTKERVDGYRALEAHYKSRGYPGTFHFVKGHGHDFFVDREKEALQFLLKQRRGTEPRAFKGLFYRYSNTPLDDVVCRRQHWIEIGQLARPKAAFTAKVEGNTIHINGDAMKGRVLVSETLVDFNKPVTLVLDGKKQEPITLERSVDFLLENWLRDRDSRRLYWNAIPFELR